MTTTYRTVKLHDAYGKVYKTTCAVRIEDGDLLQEITFCRWMPKAEAIRKAETSYQADKLRSSYGRPTMNRWEKVG